MENPPLWAKAIGNLFAFLQSGNHGHLGSACRADFYLAFGEDFSRVDFRRQSKVLNKSLRKYDFEFGQLLR